jgi:prepilin-type N-terminal cleavage/methylation domain-containing protein
MLNKNKNQTGFSVLEMIAVIAIIGLTLVGLVSLALQSFQVQRLNKNNLTAAMLAQEGIEIVRNQRDSAWKDGSGWDSVMSDGDYIVDYTGYFSEPYSITSSQAVLKINANGMYEHTNGTPTNFSRLVTLTHTDSASSTVTSQVRYRSGNNYFNYTAETILYDWNR